MQQLENDIAWRRGDVGLKKRVSEFKTLVSLVEKLAAKRHSGRGPLPPQQLYIAASMLDKKVLEEWEMTLDQARQWLGSKAVDVQGGVQEVGACTA